MNYSTKKTRFSRWFGTLRPITHQIETKMCVISMCTLFWRWKVGRHARVASMRVQSVLHTTLHKRVYCQSESEVCDPAIARINRKKKSKYNESGNAWVLFAGWNRVYNPLIIPSLTLMSYKRINLYHTVIFVCLIALSRHSVVSHRSCQHHTGKIILKWRPRCDGRKWTKKNKS